MKNNTLSLFLPAVVVPISALFCSVIGHSWSVFIFICGFGLFTSTLIWSVNRVFMLLKTKQPQDVDSMAAIIFTSSLLGVCLTFFSIVERVHWASSQESFSFLTNQEYVNSFTVNDYRLIQMVCKGNYNTPMYVSESDDSVLIRCGDFYPSIQLYQTSKKLFKNAEEEASKIDPNSPIVIETKK